MKNSEISDSQIRELENLFIRKNYQELLNSSIELKKSFPDSYILENINGIAYLSIKDLKSAENSFNRSISINSEFLKAYINLSKVLVIQGRKEEAIECLKKTLRFEFKDPEVLISIAQIYYEQDKLYNALKYFKEAYLIDQHNENLLKTIGVLLAKLNRLSESIEFFQAAIPLTKNPAPIYNNLGTVKTQMGDKSAVLDFEKAISLDPNNGSYYRSLSRIKEFEENDKEIGDMLRIFNSSEATIYDKANLAYALAKAYEDIGFLDRAFEHFKAGGLLMKNFLNYDIEYHKKLFKNLYVSIESTKKNKISLSKQDEKLKPIFVLGMPRSGTSLVEQILSSHSQVEGLGELDYINNYGKSLISNSNLIDQNAVVKFRNFYLSKINSYKLTTDYFIDKTPHNFFFIDLIKAAFPEAKIIHTIRKPEAVCWSNFKTYFSGKGIGYSYDLKDVVDFYKIYQIFMADASKRYRDIYNLSYDSLTLNSELEIKNLIKFLGLNFEEECLSPHKNSRTTQTASDMQIKKPIYKGSSDEWQKYSFFLGGAFDELKK